MGDSELGTIAVVIVATFALTKTFFSSPWYRTYARRKFFQKMCDEAGYTPNGRNVVQVPSGLDGRPGYTICLPSRPRNVGAFGTDLSRNDFQAMVGPTTFVNVVCLSPTQSETTPEHSAEVEIHNLAAYGYRLVDPINRSEMAGEQAVTYRFEGNSVELTEWKFKRDGWLFVVGLRSHAPDPATHARALRYLATWQWLPDSTKA